MAHFVIYDPGHALERVIDNIPLAHDPDYDDRVGVDAVKDPDLSGMVEPPHLYWRHDAGAIRDMDAGEKATLDAEIAADDLATRRDQGKQNFEQFAGSGMGITLRSVVSAIVREINILRRPWSRVFQAMLDAPGTVTTGTWADVTGWKDPSGALAHADFSWNPAAGVLSFLDDGIAEISVHVLGVDTGNARSQLGVRVLGDNGGGFAPIPGAEDHQYAKRNTSLTTGSAQINGFLRQVTTSGGTADLKIQVIDVDSSMTLGENSVRLTVRLWPILADRTKQQARNAIDAAIDAGEED